VDGDRGARENVAVIAAVKSGKSRVHRRVPLFAVRGGGESAHRDRGKGIRPRPLGCWGGGGGGLFGSGGVWGASPRVHDVQEAVAPHGRPGKVGAALEREPRGPCIGRAAGGVAVGGAGDIGVFPAAQISEGHIDAVATAETRVESVGGNVFLIDATCSGA